jgi:hypothetical protein
MGQGRRERVLRLETSRGVVVEKAGTLPPKKELARAVDMVVVQNKAWAKAKVVARVGEKINNHQQIKQRRCYYARF